MFLSLSRLRKRITTPVKVGAAVIIALAVALYALARSVDVETYRSVIEARASQALGREVSLDGPMSLDILTLHPAIRLENVRVANVDGADNPDMLTIRRANLEISILPLLSSELVIRRLDIRDAALSLEVDSQGRSNWTFPAGGSAAGAKTPTGPEPGAGASDGLKAQIHALRFRRVAITYTDARSATRRQIAMDQIRMDIEPGGKAARLAGQGSYEKQDFSLDLRVPSLAAWGDEEEDIVLEGGGDFLASRIDVDILWQRAAAALRFDVGVSGRDLRTVSRFFRLPLPGGEYEFSIAGTREGETYHIERFYSRLGTSSWTGNGRVRRGKVPDIVIALQSDVLDMADFALGPPPPRKEGAVPGRSEPVVSDRPLPVEEMARVDIDVAMRIQRLVIESGHEFRAVQGSLGLRDSRLAIDLSAASLFGGAVEARMTLEGKKTPPVMTLTLDVDNGDFGEALAVLADIRDIQGRGEIDLSLRGTGVSAAQWMASLKGDGAVILENGTIDNGVFSFASAPVLELLLPWIGSDQSNVIECSVQRFNVVQGVADARTFLIRGPDFAVTGSGRVDLGKRNVDLVLTPHTENLSLLSVMIPLKISGSWSDPSIRPDPAATVGKALSSIGGLARSLGEGLNVLDDGAAEGASASLPSCAEALADAGAEGQERKQRQRKARRQGDDLFRSLEEGLGKLFE